MTHEWMVPENITPEERKKLEDWEKMFRLLGCPFDIELVRPSNQNKPDSQHPEFDSWKTIGFVGDYIYMTE